MHLKTYLNFCEEIKACPVPATQSVICMFAASLANRIKPSSVRQYLNIVRLLHIENGYVNPLQDNWELKSTLRGIDRLHGSPINRKAPITPVLLLKMKSFLTNSVFDINFWAACLLLFFGMLRKSNVMPDNVMSFSKDKQFIRSDFNFESQCICVRVKWSKTIQNKERAYVIRLPFLGTSLCPVDALNKAFSLCPLSDDSPAIVSSALGSPMTSGLFIKKLKFCMTLCGVNAGAYSSHSFRRGSATWALSSGVPGEIVKIMGDWKSSVYMDYLDQVPQSVVHSYVNKFSSCLPSDTY